MSDTDSGHATQPVAGNADAAVVKFEELIERLERTTELDRELDLRLHGVIHWPNGNWEVSQVANDRFGSELFWSWVLLRHTAANHIILVSEVPYYTSDVHVISHEPFRRKIKIVSVAMTPDGRYSAMAMNEAGEYHTGEATLESIARLIAILKARAAPAITKAVGDREVVPAGGASA